MCCQGPRAKAAPGRGWMGLDGRGAERIQGLLLLGWAFLDLGLYGVLRWSEYDGVQTTKSPGQWAMGPRRSE